MVDELVESESHTQSAASRLGPRRIYYGYWLVGAAFIAQFIAIGAQNYVFGAFISPLEDEFGWSRWEITLARTIGQSVMASSTLPGEQGRCISRQSHAAPSVEVRLDSAI